MEVNEKRFIDEDELSLKDLILKIREYFLEVLRNWKLVIAIAIPICAFFIYGAVSSPVTFNAKLTFMVNEEEGNSIGGLSSVLGNILPAGGGGSNLARILELSKSRNIMEQVILDTVTINRKEDKVGNLSLIHI